MKRVVVMLVIALIYSMSYAQVTPYELKKWDDPYWADAFKKASEWVPPAPGNGWSGTNIYPPDYFTIPNYGVTLPSGPTYGYPGQRGWNERTGVWVPSPYTNSW